MTGRHDQIGLYIECIEVVVEDGEQSSWSGSRVQNPDPIGSVQSVPVCLDHAAVGSVSAVAGVPSVQVAQDSTTAGGQILSVEDFHSVSSNPFLYRIHESA